MNSIQPMSQGLSQDATAEDCQKAFVLLGRHVGGDRHIQAWLTPQAKPVGTYKLQFQGSNSKVYANSEVLDAVYASIPADKRDNIHYKRHLLRALKTSDEECYISGLTLPQSIETANLLATSTDKDEAKTNTQHHQATPLLSQFAQIETERLLAEGKYVGLHSHKISPSQLKKALSIIDSAIEDLDPVGNDEVRIRIPYSEASYSIAPVLLEKYKSIVEPVDNETDTYFQIILPIRELVDAINGYAAQSEASEEMIAKLTAVTSRHHMPDSTVANKEDAFGAYVSNVPQNVILAESLDTRKEPASRNAVFSYP